MGGLELEGLQVDGLVEVVTWDMCVVSSTLSISPCSSMSPMAHLVKHNLIIIVSRPEGLSTTLHAFRGDLIGIWTKTLTMVLYCLPVCWPTLMLGTPKRVLVEVGVGRMGMWPR